MANGDVGIGELIGGLWDLLTAGWREGGLAFLLFVALLAFVSDRFVSGKRYAQAIADWEKRYKEDTAQWRERYELERQRSDKYIGMLLGQMHVTASSTDIARQVTSVAEKVVSSTVPATANSPPGREPL